MINSVPMPKVTEVELVYHNRQKPSERMKIHSSEHAYKLFYDTWDKGKLELQEQFRVLLLDQSSSCLGISTLASGGVAQCVVDLKLVFAMALKAKASGIIIAHNHPSGNKKPSENDKTLTAQFSIAGRILDIPVLDHLIITNEGYTSMAVENLMSSKPLK